MILEYRPWHYRLSEGYPKLRMCAVQLHPRWPDGHASRLETVVKDALRSAHARWLQYLSEGRVSTSTTVLRPWDDWPAALPERSRGVGRSVQVTESTQARIAILAGDITSLKRSRPLQDWACSELSSISFPFL